jgi:pyruvate dehydrogenase E2 component (dihydrolipoamide acetyltransferase)
MVFTPTMSYLVRMPKLGMEMEEGDVLGWLKTVNQAVEAEEPIAEIESEKTTAEVESREDGVLREIFVEAGETVEVGTPIGLVAGPEEDISDLKAEAESELGRTGLSSEPDTTNQTSDELSSDSESTPVEDPVRASPRAKKLADDHDIELNIVEGSGPSGTVTAEDVEVAIEEDTSSAIDERSLSATRRTIADRLSRSQSESVAVTLCRDVPIERLQRKVDAEDERVSLVDGLIHSVSKTLETHPEFNATFENEIHRLHDAHNISLAVDTDRGLVTPVLSDLEGASISEIAEKRSVLTERALQDDLEDVNLRGGTFTISNLGPFGVKYFNPVINPPQIAILGVGATYEQATRTDEGSGFEFSSYLPLSFTFDHRVVDGADAARFLSTLNERILEV